MQRIKGNRTTDVGVTEVLARMNQTSEHQDRDAQSIYFRTRERKAHVTKHLAISENMLSLYNGMLPVKKKIKSTKQHIRIQGKDTGKHAPNPSRDLRCGVQPMRCSSPSCTVLTLRCHLTTGCNLTYQNGSLSKES